MTLDTHIEADALVQEGSAVQQPPGLVEVRWTAAPVLVIGFELNGPLAGVLAGQEAGKPGGPDVGKFSLDGQGGTRGMGDAYESIGDRVGFATT